jgi:hypothetical protein
MSTLLLQQHLNPCRFREVRAAEGLRLFRRRQGAQAHKVRVQIRGLLRSLLGNLQALRVHHHRLAPATQVLMVPAQASRLLGRVQAKETAIHKEITMGKGAVIRRGTTMDKATVTLKVITTATHQHPEQRHKARRNQHRRSS